LASEPWLLLLFGCFEHDFGPGIASDIACYRAPFARLIEPA